MESKTTRLRVAQPDDAERAEDRQRFNNACEAALREALAEEPCALCIVYETEDQILCKAVPKADSTVRGLIQMLTLSWGT